MQLSLSSFATLFESVAKGPDGQRERSAGIARGEAPTGASDGHGGGNAS